MLSTYQEAHGIQTPAKITPFLHVLARRPDGFHEVRLGLVPVSLYDSIAIEIAPGRGIALEVDGPEPLGPPEDNLVHRAARAFQRASGTLPGLRLHLRKHIPAGAGLGGGSGNAAGTLVALNTIAGRPLSGERLAALALGLGADVPFFLAPRPSLAEGRGERLQPLEGFPELPVLIVKPPFAVSTAAAYRAVRPRPRPASAGRLDSLAAVVGALHNDFEAPLFGHYPELAAIKRRLLEAGAAGALLSGSGSALFGVFADAPARDRALRALSAEPSWRVWPCATLARHDYLPTASRDS